MNQSVRLQTSSVQNQAQVVHDNITKAKNLMMNMKNSLEVSFSLIFIIYFFCAELISLDLKNIFGAAHCEIKN